MTNAEAVEILREIIQPFLCVSEGKCWEAIDMAISALEKQEQKKPLTNADKIRAMTDEELAKHLYYVTNYSCPPGKEFTVYSCGKYPECKKCWLDWLKQEVSDGSPKD